MKCLICSRDEENCLCTKDDLDKKEKTLITELDQAINSLESISENDKNKVLTKGTSESSIKVSNFIEKEEKKEEEKKEEEKKENDNKTIEEAQSKEGITSNDSYYAVFIDGLLNVNEKEEVFKIFKEEGIDSSSENFTSLMKDSKILLKGLNEVKAYLIASKLKKFTFNVEVALENEILNIINKSNISNRIFSPIDLSKNICLYTTDTMSHNLRYKYISFIRESLYINIEEIDEQLNILENKLKLKAFNKGANAVLGVKFSFIDTSTGLYSFIYGTAIKIDV